MIAAGSAFTGTAIAGLLIGIWLDRIERTGFCAVIGLFAGVLAGGYAAFRLLMQATTS